jgi:hypothetical protein
VDRMVRGSSSLLGRIGKSPAQRGFFMPKAGCCEHPPADKLLPGGKQRPLCTSTWQRDGRTPEAAATAREPPPRSRRLGGSAAGRLGHPARQIVGVSESRRWTRSAGDALGHPGAFRRSLGLRIARYALGKTAPARCGSRHRFCPRLAPSSDDLVRPRPAVVSFRWPGRRCSQPPRGAAPAIAGIGCYLLEDRGTDVRRRVAIEVDGGEVAAHDGDPRWPLRERSTRGRGFEPTR